MYKRNKNDLCILLKNIVPLFSEPYILVRGKYSNVFEKVCLIGTTSEKKRDRGREKKAPTEFQLQKFLSWKIPVIGINGYKWICIRRCEQIERERERRKKRNYWDFLYEIMKPAVINNTSETPTQTHHEQNNSNNQANNGQPNNDHSRRFPQFRVSVTFGARQSI